jgi:arylsulfatase
VRDQFVHAIDVMPTVLDVCGVQPPEVVDGVTQQRIDGASMRATFDDRAAPSPRDVQYFEMLGSRSIVADGWKATTDHVSFGVVDEERLVEGSRVFADDRWSLFRLADDFAEAHDLAAEHPEVVRDLQQRWTAEAGANQVFPLVDELIGRFGAMLAPPNPPRAHNVYRPEAGPVPDDSVPRFFGGVRVTAEVTVPPAGARGVLCAMGDWTGGFALTVQDGRLVFALNRAGDATAVASEIPLPRGRHDLGFVYRPDTGVGASLALFHDDEVVADVTLPFPFPLVWQHGGTALQLGSDRGLPVSPDYEVPFPWTGELHRVVVDVGADLSPGTASGTAPGTAEDLRAALHSE